MKFNAMLICVCCVLLAIILAMGVVVMRYETKYKAHVATPPTEKENVDKDGNVKVEFKDGVLQINIDVEAIE